MDELLATPRGWLESFGEIVRFGSTMVRDIATLRVFRFFGEALRQAGILIVSSTLVIWGLVFIIGLQCGIEGAYFTAAQGAPAYSGVFTAWCDLREITPYAFGYMMSAKVGTGIVAELGAMRISDEIDALEVMNIPPARMLVMPRLAAVLVMMPVLTIIANLVGWFGGAVVARYVRFIGIDSESYFSSLRQYVKFKDVANGLFKAEIFGFMVVLVSCSIGLSTRGGPREIGASVTRAVVTSLILILVLDFVLTHALI